MQAALRLTRDHLDAIKRQMKDRAESAAMAQANKSRHVARHCTSWTAADESRFQIHFAAEVNRRAGEIRSLVHKRARQEAAIAAFLDRHRFNEPLAA
jgi:hypothetical protein